MPPTVASSLLAMIGIFNVAGTVSSGWLTDRVSAKWLLTWYFALRGAALLCLPLLMSATVQPSLVLFVVIFGILDVATVPPTIALARTYFGEDGAIVFGGSTRHINWALAAWLSSVALCGTWSAHMTWCGSVRQGCAQWRRC